MPKPDTTALRPCGWRGNDFMKYANDNSERYRLGVETAKAAIPKISGDQFERALSIGEGSPDPYAAGWMHTIEDHWRRIAP